jgi:hypothetical protein
MATLKQLLPNSKPYPTKKAGTEYHFCRPFIAIWRKFNAFLDATKAMEASGTNMVDEKFLDDYTAFLYEWLKENHPDITPEEIEREFDVLDVPGIKQIVMEFYAEIAAAAPPDFSPGNGEPEAEPEAEQ